MTKKFFPFYLLLLLITIGKQEAQAQRLDPGGAHTERTLKPQPDLGKYNQAMQARGLRFTENKGQVADFDGKLRPDVLFTAQNDGVKLFLTAQGIHYQFRREFVKQQVADGKMQLPVGKTMQEIEKTEFYRLDLGLKGANPRPVVQTEGAGQDIENFFLAHAPQGIEGVRNFSKITYKEVYPHIDWVVYTKNGGLEYDFVVRPGGKVSDIQLGYDGEQSLVLQKNGALQVTTPLGSITENKPYSFQEAGKEVKSRFVVSEDGFGFDVPSYDKNATLTIDPTVQWATYYGGSGEDEGNDVATDASGNVYLAGNTYSTENLSFGGYQNENPNGTINAFLVKFDGNGNRIWATYYGGEYTTANSIITDVAGNIYMTGVTTGSMPASNQSNQVYFNQNSFGSFDAYLVKFDSDGKRRLSGYIGGSDMDNGTSLALGDDQSIYVAGETFSTGAFGVNGYSNVYGGNNIPDLFLVKLNVLTGITQWSTYYGSAAQESSARVVTDQNGFVILTGNYSANNNLPPFLPISGGYQTQFGGGSVDAFVVKFSSLGQHVWSTYVGGDGIDYGFGLATDIERNIILGGMTGSSNNIASPGFDGYNGLSSFIVKINEDGNKVWGRYFAGNNIKSIEVAPGSNSPIYVCSDASTNILFGKLTSTGMEIWQMYYGQATGFGTQNVALALGNTGNLFFSGTTRATVGISTSGFQQLLAGNEDAFLGKITTEDMPALPEISSFSPSYAKRGADILINGSNFGGTHQVFFGSISASNFIIKTPGQISVKVPAGQSSGKIRVVTHQGSAISSTDFTLDVSDVPIYWFRDRDSDGFGNPNVYLYSATQPNGYVTTTGDCNDLNNTIYPGAPELGDGLDNDCDNEVDEGLACRQLWYRDIDGDGYGRPNNPRWSCVQPAGYVAILGDCNDGDPNFNIGAPELADGQDNDCDGIIDEDLDCQVIWYQDADGDGFGRSSNSRYSCTQPAGYVSVTGDCNDNDAAMYPGATEVMDGKDNDCNGTVDDVVIISLWYFDKDGDGYGDPTITMTTDVQPDGYVALGGDCNDNNASINPGAAETGDGIDNNCNGDVDEGLPCRKLWYKDFDGDGYGRTNNPIWSCVQPDNHVLILGDCNDGDPNFNMGATELPDGLDNNCNGQIDEGAGLAYCRITWYRDADGDGYGRTNQTVLSCVQPDGFVNNSNDCNDGDNTIYGGAPELPDGKDNDCDGQVDEGLGCLITWYQDKDGDGFGRKNRTKKSCIQPIGYVSNFNDCNDGDATIYPGAPELCDGKDNDCDGTKDEGCGPLMTGTQNQTSAHNMLAAQKVAPEKISANAYPNPHNGSFVLEVQSPVAGKGAIVLYDLQGRAIVQRQEQLQVGTNRVRFDAVQKTTFMYKVTIGAHSVAGKVLSVQ